MQKRHFNLLKPYIEKLNSIYEIDVLYDQEKTALDTKYNYIHILLETDYTDNDFQHEFLHLHFLTQNGRIKYLYPLKPFKDDMTILFINVFVNIVYDIYVDSKMAFDGVACQYFVNKYEIFRKLYENINIYYKMNKQYLQIIKKALSEYIYMLDKVIKKDFDSIKYLFVNDIGKQIEHVNEYLLEAKILHKFEWVTHQELHLRKKGVNK